MQPAHGLAFKALADPTRRSLFERLVQEGEQTVGRLTDFAGVAQPTVSKHLRILREADLVRPRPAGRQTFYSARPQALSPMARWLEHYAGAWAESFDRLDDLLERMDP